MASLGAIFAELAALDRTDAGYGLNIALAIATVVLSWAFTHTIFALHYAHEFYGEHAARRRPEISRRRRAGLLGLRLFLLRHRHDVPGVGRRGHPQAWSGGRSWSHGVLSFFFTTAIVALTVNIAANMMQR